MEPGPEDTLAALGFTELETRVYVIPARVNGHDTMVLLDSGAETTVLDATFARSLGLEGAGRITALGSGGTQEASLAPDIDIELGNLKLAGITAAIIDFTRVAAALGHGLPVVLGKEILNETVVEIDFAGRRIAFHDPAHYAPSAACASSRSRACASST